MISRLPACAPRPTAGYHGPSLFYTSLCCNMSMRRGKTYNAKRHICEPPPTPTELERLARQVGYAGNPEHKRNPGDFGLTPPSCPRADKSLCDVARIFRRKDALALLRAGIGRGLISRQWVDKFPQNVWAVTEDGQPVEAQLENQAQGTYHGYPMPESDPFRNVVLEQWSRRGLVSEAND